jgi:hypothetical protein
MTSIRSNQALSTGPSAAIAMGMSGYASLTDRAEKVASARQAGPVAT